MRVGTGYAAELLELPTAVDDRTRRMLFRQAMASLAHGAAAGSSLSALEPAALESAVQVALDHGLFDDLDWLAPQAAGLALYELASALPHGKPQRELGRRLLGRLYLANAAVFAVVAARMASGSTKALLSPSVRARVALTMELPLSHGVNDGPLALAILGRRELARTWVEQGSMGSLPARRLAARLFERAAREAAFRAVQGESLALRPFAQEPIVQSFERLLGDREPLVWRYAAAARGLLAPHVPAFAAQLHEGLGDELSPTEWRRAATSLVALTATDPILAESLVARLVPLLERDPGMASALVWGLPRAAESDEKLAKRWLDVALSVEPFAAAEALCDFLADYGEESFSAPAVAATLAATQRLVHVGDKPSLRDALLQEYRRELEAHGRVPGTLRAELLEAMDKFALEGATVAFGSATAMLDSARASADVLVSADSQSSLDRLQSLETRTTANLLRDVSLAVIERNALFDLLRLGAHQADVVPAHARLESIREEVESWLLSEERSNDVMDPAVSLRRVRALLHLADGDADDDHDTDPRAEQRSARWVRIAQTFVRRSMHSPPEVLRRVLLAACARACDGLVREGEGDLVDPFLLLISALDQASSFETLASASTTPDLVFALDGYAKFLHATEHDEPPAPARRGDSLMPPALVLAPYFKLQQWVGALERLAVEHLPEFSQRSEAFRAVLLRIASVLVRLLKADTLQAVVQHGGQGDSVLEELERAMLALHTITLPALRRFGMDEEILERGSSATETTESLTVMVGRVVAGSEPALRDVLLQNAVNVLGRGVPRAVGDLVSAVVYRLLSLPKDASVRPSQPMMPAPLPQWVPARRSVGGFYLLRTLGGGSAGSVFQAVRVEERHDPAAERLALKVPEYSETAARTLTEAQFLKLFRDEASALLALPDHENLSRFVTFDAGTRPKPILVTEYVEGVTVEHMLQARSLDVARAVSILDDVAAGLSAMHAVGLGHLDVKPSNLILRQERAVLVDFGLSGRTVRPGCATAEYGAPEVWTATEPGQSPGPVDVYAVACVAYELLTGEILFDAANEMAIIGKHLGHDGVPEGILALARNPRTQELAELLCSALRREPARRIGMHDFREAFRRVARRLEKESWPLPA